KAARASRPYRQPADSRLVRAVHARRSAGRIDRGGEAEGAGGSARHGARARVRLSRRDAAAARSEAHAMRIVAGRFRGATLLAPKGTSTRPTSDRVRQALFNVLEHGEAAVTFDDARVLDLFAGSGA